MNIKHAIMVYINDPTEIIHFCGYEVLTPPCWKSLKEELATDEEFGLTHVADQLKYRLATQEELDYIVPRLDFTNE